MYVDFIFSNVISHVLKLLEMHDMIYTWKTLYAAEDQASNGAIQFMFIVFSVLA